MDLIRVAFTVREMKTHYAFLSSEDALARKFRDRAKSGGERREESGCTLVPPTALAHGKSISTGRGSQPSKSVFGGLYHCENHAVRDTCILKRFQCGRVRFKRARGRFDLGNNNLHP